MTIEPSRRFAVDGVELAWDRYGQPSGGVPLLLCHGFSGSAHDWELHIDALAADREVIVVDHRGHGRSTKLGRDEAYSIVRLTDDLIALIDAEVGGPVDLLGHSMGGAISLRLTSLRPDLVHSLIMMDTSAWSFRPTNPAMAELFTAFFASFDPVNGLPDFSAMPNPEDAVVAVTTSAEWRARKDELDAAFDPWAMRALGHDLFASDVVDQRAALPALRCPFTVIVGSNDEPFVSQAAEMASLVPGGQLVVIEGAYHSPQLTHQQEWRAALAAHLART